MSNLLTIHTEQLQEGKREPIDLTLAPDFLDISEDGISFANPIVLKGETYVVTDHLVLQLSVAAKAQMPCTICNKKAVVPLETQEIYHTIPLTELKSTIFDYTDLLREEIVLLIPQFVECNNGKCPERVNISKYMKKKDPSPDQHFPFADL